MLNLVKNKKFPDRHFFVYRLSKQELGSYLNLWMAAEPIYTTSKSHKRRKHRGQNTVLVSDSWNTVKKVDAATALNLYGYKYNPISLYLFSLFPYKKKDMKYSLKAVIHSVDDSSFGIWWKKDDYDKLSPIRLKVMEWINTQKIINGEEFLKQCILLGADESTIDYN